MSHKQQQDYCADIRARFPRHFKNVRALDVGSLNINGHNRGLFEQSDYTGLDLAPGSNVDVVGKAHEFDAPLFDTVISTEMLEHDMYWQESLTNMHRLLRVGGLLVLTCAGHGRAEHGTRRHDSGCSPFTCRDETWQDYYRNLSKDDLRSVLTRFSWQFAEYSEDTTAKDTYFVGVKG